MYFKMVAYHMGKIIDCVDNCLFARCPSWYRQKQFCGRYQCSFCQKLLKKGDSVVRIIYYMDKGYYGEREGQKHEKQASLMFHRDCYLEHTKLWIDNQLFLHPVKSKSKAGRPKKYKDPVEANRLKTRQNQYKKAGNWDRVKELGTRLKEMEVKE